MPRVKKETPQTDLPVVDMDANGVAAVPVTVPLRTFMDALGGHYLSKSTWEIAGLPGTGKSTLALFLAGTLPDCELVEVMDTENMSLSPAYYAQAVGQSGYRGRIHLTPMADAQGELLSDTARLNMVTDVIKSSTVASVVVDSIAGLIPANEMSNNIGDRNMGERAFTLGQSIKKANRAALVAPAQKLVLYVNHLRPDFSGYGMSTPGGTQKDFGLIYRLRLSLSGDKIGPEVLHVVGEVRRTKIKEYGQAERKFSLVIVPAVGVHVGLTAVVDAVNLGIAKKSAGYVTMDGKKYGRISDMAAELNTFDFSPFIEAVNARD